MTMNIFITISFKLTPTFPTQKIYISTFMSDVTMNRKTDRISSETNASQMVGRFLFLFASMNSKLA